MQRRLLTVFTLVTFLAASCTRDNQSKPSIKAEKEGMLSASHTSIATRARPRFEDFPVSQQFKGPVAQPDLRNDPNARAYRTVLQAGAKLPATFAGQCTVVLWGCGSPCTRFAIVNLRSGHVFVSPEVFSAGISYRRDSELLVLEPPSAVRELCQSGMDPFCDSVYSFYYRWDGSRLMLIDSVLVDSTRTSTSSIK